jgi:hypothetical protein
MNVGTTMIATTTNGMRASKIIAALSPEDVAASIDAMITIKSITK